MLRVPPFSMARLQSGCPDVPDLTAMTSSPALDRCRIESQFDVVDRLMTSLGPSFLFGPLAPRVFARGVFAAHVKRLERAARASWVSSQISTP